MISYIFPFVKQNGKIFYSNYFPYLIIAEKTGKIALYSFIRTIKPGAVEALPFLADKNPYSSVWCNCVFITFTISTHEYPRIKLFNIFIFDIDGKNLPFWQIDERRHLKVFGKSVSGLCRVTIPFTPHQ